METQEKIERCEKVPHSGTGYLHDEDDDRPYDVDGVKYCGRCHRYDCRGFKPEVGSSNKGGLWKRFGGA